MAVRWVALIALGFTAVTAACSPSSEVMAKGPPNTPPPVGAPGVATIVFIRSSTYAFARDFRIVDHDGRFVGEALAGSYFVVKPQPGEYVFIVGDDAIDVLYVNAAAGFTYYVDVVPVLGPTPKARFHPVRPGSSEWNRLGKRLHAPAFTPLFDKGQAAVQRDARLASRIERAKKMWAELPAYERASHSLGRTEGAPLSR